MTLTADIQAAIGKVPANGWTPGYEGAPAPGAQLRCAKDAGLRNLPLKGFAQNQLWCEIVALACEQPGSQAR